MKTQITNSLSFFKRLINHQAGAVETIVFTAVLIIISVIILYVFAPQAFMSKY